MACTMTYDAVQALLAFPIASFNFNAQPYIFAIFFEEMAPSQGQPGATLSEACTMH